MKGIFLCWLVALLIMGCSGNQSLPTGAGSDEALRPGEKGVANQHPITEGHSLWGMWTVRMQADGSEYEISPLRDTQLHLNAITFLEPPPNGLMKIESVSVEWGKLNVDISLRHPFPGAPEYTGFDVKGIVILPGSETRCTSDYVTFPSTDETRLINADGYTRWWNPREFPQEEGGMPIMGYTDGILGTPDDVAQFTSTLNGYKYFADSLDLTQPAWQLPTGPRGMFGSGSYNRRRYIFDVKGSEIIFNYAVDASWWLPNPVPPVNLPGDFSINANQQEPYAFKVEEIKNTLYNDGAWGGGDYEADVTVYTWRPLESIAHVSMEIPGAFGPVGEEQPVATGDGWVKYSLKAHAASPRKSGELQVLIRAACTPWKNYGGRLEYTPLSAFYVHRTAAGTAPQGGEPGTVKGYRFGEITDYPGLVVWNTAYNVADSHGERIGVPCGGSDTHLLESTDGGFNFDGSFAGNGEYSGGPLKYGPNGEAIIWNSQSNILFYYRAPGADSFEQRMVDCVFEGQYIIYLTFEIDKNTNRLYAFFYRADDHTILQTHTDNYLNFSEPVIIEASSPSKILDESNGPTRDSFLGPDGTLYFVTIEKGSSPFPKHVYFRKGTPNALGPKIILDQGPSDIRKTFPQVVVADSGVIHVAWLAEKRGVDQGETSEWKEVYYCSSMDGVNFTPQRRISYDGANNFTWGLLMSINGNGEPIIIFDDRGYNQLLDYEQVDRRKIRQITIKKGTDIITAPVDCVRGHNDSELIRAGDLSFTYADQSRGFLFGDFTENAGELYCSAPLYWLYY